MPDLSLWLWMVTLTTGLVASVVTTITGIGEGMMLYGILGFFFGLNVFIPIKSLAATGSSAPESYAGHNRVPSRDRGCPPSTDGCGL
jgi:hypothetical protein